MKNKKPQLKRAQIVIRLEEKDRLELEREAEAEGRKLGDYTRRILLGLNDRPWRKN